MGRLTLQYPKTSPTSDLEGEGESKQKEDPRPADKMADSERVREGWDSLPGEEIAVDYNKSVPLLVGVDPGFNVIDINLRLWDGLTFSVSDSCDGPITSAQIVEALDRLNGSVMSWVDAREHQRNL